MQAVVGVDVDGLYQPALNLLSRLKFNDLDLELLHVDEAPVTFPEGDFAWSRELLVAQEQVDNDVMDRAVAAVANLGLKCTTSIHLGSAADILIERAQSEHAHLIAIGSHDKGRIQSLFFGSVGRALAIGAHRSVLIAKGNVEPSGPITAVLTTDHSKYSDRAIRWLTHMHPTGIGRLILLTALNSRTIGGADEKHIDRLTGYLEQRNARLAEHLTEKGIPTEARVARGEVDRVVEAQMKEVNADLLIMGAQGHGFIERLLIGSTSLKQVVATHHSVLLLRPSHRELH